MRDLKYLAEVIIFEEVVIMSLLMSYPDNFDLFRSPFEKLISDIELPKKHAGIRIGEKTYHEYEMPGASLEDTKVVLKDHKVIIDASRKTELSDLSETDENSEKPGNYLKKTANYHFELSVDKNVTAKEISYNLVNGILTLIVADASNRSDEEVILPTIVNTVAEADNNVLK